MPWPNAADWTLACGALEACQLLTTLRFSARSRRIPRREGPPPSVCVVIPCKGASPSHGALVASLARQRYDAPAEFLLVLAREDDPARAPLETLLAETGDPRLRLLVSGARPASCSEQILNLLHGLERARPSDVVAFADSDLVLPDGWLQALTSPLGEPGVGASTAAMLYLPSRPGFFSLLRMAWELAGIPPLDLMGCVAGHSFALRRADFERLGVAALWRRCLSHDLSVSSLIRSAGLTTRWAVDAMPVCEEGCTARGLFGLFDKWLALFRVYQPRVWVLGALVTALKTWLLVFSIAGRHWPPLALLLGGDALNLALVAGLLRRELPEQFARLSASYRPAELFMALAAPLLLPVYIVNFAVSALTRSIVWGGYRYRIRGAQSISAAPAGS